MGSKLKKCGEKFVQKCRLSHRAPNFEKEGGEQFLLRGADFLLLF